MKLKNSLSYCYSFGYDVDHNGCQCHPNTRKRTHIPNVSRDESHTISRASMKAQHKTLPDSSREGKGCILAQQLSKANWVMEQQYNWKQQQQQQQYRGWRLGAAVSRSAKIDKQNIEPNTANLLYPTTHNTNNRFAILATTDDDDNKITIIDN